MSTLSSFGGGSGGTPLNYTEATQDMVLEANTKYMLNDNVTNVILPDTTSLTVGDVVILSRAPTRGAVPTITAYDSNVDTIVFNNTIHGFWGASAGNPTASITHDNTDIELYWTGVLWTELPSNDTADGLLPDSFERVEFTSSGTFTVPASANGQISITVVGGGGGGDSSYNTGARYGGSGAAGIYKEVLSVNTGDVLTITVGAGGSGTSVSYGKVTSGSAGGTSKVNDGTNDILVAGGGGFAGGGGGTVSGTITPTYGYNGGAGGSGGNSGGSVNNTATSTTYNGGSGSSSGYASGGGGGASPFGHGGNGVATSNYVNGEKSAGGGGGGWGNGRNGYVNGYSYRYWTTGRGASGGVIIYWGSEL